MRNQQHAVLTADPPRRRRISWEPLLLLTLVAGLALGIHEPTASADDVVLDEPGVCLEFDATIVDEAAWLEIHRAVAQGTLRHPDFFPDFVMETFPQVDLPRSDGDPSLKIGIWGDATGIGGSLRDRREILTRLDCGRGSQQWGWRISRAFLLAGADSILAGARVSAEGGAPPIPENADASIDVALDKDAQHIRTMLTFNVPLGPFRPGGTCWIDDAIAVDGEIGQAVTTATSGMQVDPFVESGCERFHEFMTEGGAGQMALAMTPVDIEIEDGSVVRMVVRSSRLDKAAMVLAGTVERS